MVSMHLESCQSLDEKGEKHGEACVSLALQSTDSGGCKHIGSASLLSGSCQLSVVNQLSVNSVVETCLTAPQRGNGGLFKVRKKDEDGYVLTALGRVSVEELSDTLADLTIPVFLPNQSCIHE